MSPRSAVIVLLALSACRSSSSSAPGAEERPGQSAQATAADPVERWKALVRAGDAAYEAGRYDEAAGKLTEALAAMEGQAAAPADLRALAHYTLASVHVEQRRLDPAIEHYEKSLALDRARLGDDSADVANALEALANAYDYKGDHAEAEKRFREVIARRERLHGSDSRELAVALVNLAISVDNQDRDDEAEVLYRRAVAILDRDPSMRDDLASALGALGSVEYEQKRLADARRTLTRALELREAESGRDHPKVATILFNLATVELDSENVRAAAAHCDRCVAIREKALPADHPWLVEARALCDEIHVR